MMHASVNHPGLWILSRVRPAVMLSFCLLGAGCATHSQTAGRALAGLKTGNPAPALSWAEKLKSSSFSKPLGYIESGRIKMLQGDFSGSRREFEVAIDQILEETETGPVIRAGAVTATLAASTVADDTLRTYQLPPYEFIQLLHYQTLNYLLGGDPAGAGVEMRRTVFAQEAIAEKYANEVRKLREASQSAQPKAVDSVEARMETLAPVLERTRSSRENGLAWYFCGLLFEMEGDAANAALSYRKAQELAPDNRTIRRDFLRLLRTQDSGAFRALTANDPAAERELARSPTELVILYEESLISLRIAEKIPVPIPDFSGSFTLIAIDFPFYSDGAWPWPPLPLSAGGRALGEAERAVDLQSLAYRDLKEKMPGMVLRNVTRAAAKTAAQHVAGSGENSGLYAGIAVFNLVSALATTADTRAWYSLPMGTRLYRGSVPPGDHILQFRHPVSGAAMHLPVTVAEGETRLVWVADPGAAAVAATASLNGKGLPPTFQKLTVSPNSGTQ